VVLSIISLSASAFLTAAAIVAIGLTFIGIFLFVKSMVAFYAFIVIEEADARSSTASERNKGQQRDSSSSGNVQEWEAAASILNETPQSMYQI
jgi:hypothetical protein